LLRTKNDFLQLMKGNDPSNHVSATMVAGGLAGLAGWTVAIPMDTAKSRHQALLPASRSVDTLRNLFAAEGLRGFYRGAAPILLSAVPANAAAFLGYETALRIMAKTQDCSY
jgi:solute carrier family 25 carnitine/acylcarnitine transporter 20/29